METYLNSGRQVEYHSNFVIEGNTVGEEWNDRVIVDARLSSEEQ